MTHLKFFNVFLSRSFSYTLNILSQRLNEKEPIIYLSLDTRSSLFISRLIQDDIMILTLKNQKYRHKDYPMSIMKIKNKKNEIDTSNCRFVSFVRMTSVF